MEKGASEQQFEVFKDKMQVNEAIRGSEHVTSHPLWSCEPQQKQTKQRVAVMIYCGEPPQIEGCWETVLCASAAFYHIF